MLLRHITITVLLLLPIAGAAVAQGPLHIEDIEITGTTRTPLETVLRYLPLAPGDEIDQEALLGAVAELRAAGLFSEVDFHTRPGSERGRLVLVLEVAEQGVDLRFGTGNTNLDGWYLVPVKVTMDNRLGRGEHLAAQWRVGFRHNSLEVNLDETAAGDGRDFWGSGLFIGETNRVYYADGVELGHDVRRAGWRALFGRRLSEALSAEIGIRTERVEVDSFAVVGADDESLGVEDGDRLDFDDLPDAVREAVGLAGLRNAIHFQLGHDSRHGGLVAGSPAAGLWGRVRVEEVLQGDRSFPNAELDVRAYGHLGSFGLALRARGRAVGSKAPFYDRLYLGGHYTVRGFGDQSLSAAGGDTWLWSTSAEMRAPLIGDASLPRLAGLLFFDAGASGVEGESPGDEIYMGTGFGIRLRAGWLGWLGLDAGIPLSTGPTDDAFHVHASIGWSF